MVTGEKNPRIFYFILHPKRSLAMLDDEENKWDFGRETWITQFSFEDLTASGDENLHYSFKCILILRVYAIFFETRCLN